MTYWQAVATPVVITMIAVLGLYIIGQSGRISIGHAAFFGLGAYIAGYGSTALGLQPAVAITLGAILTSLIGFVVAHIVEPLGHFSFAIATLAVGEAFKTAIANVPELGGGVGLSGVPLVVDFWSVFWILIACVGIVYFYDHTRFARRARAVADSPSAAAALGISARRVHVSAFAFGTALAGLAGGLYIHYLGLVGPTELDFEHSFSMLVFLVLGGTASVLGPIFGTASLGLLPEFLRFSEGSRFVLYGAVITLVMTIRPRGLITWAPLLKRRPQNDSRNSAAIEQSRDRRRA